VLLCHVDPYILNFAQVRVIDNALAAVARLTELGIPVAVVTNQSCVDRGLTSRQFVDDVCSWLLRQARLAGGDLAGFHVCPHTPGAGCGCRKPEPGLLCEAIRAVGAAPSHTWMVGDHDTDIVAGRRARCGYVVHVRSGRQKHPAPLADASFTTLAEAVAALLPPPGDAVRG
jgi:D-glycero-D-manno-heptose 1,7-bisphosphate phosphatase